MILAVACAGAAILASMTFVFRRSLRYLHYFQQDEYDAGRFLPWVVRTIAWDRRLSLALALAGAAFLFMGDAWAQNLAAAVLFAAAAMFEPDPRRASKKPLVLTQRAKEILWAAMALAAALAVALAFASRAWVWIVAAQAPPLLLVLGNWLLTPHERARQAAILREAKARLAEINPTVIGVTGSFGKTTVKHMLGNLLGLADDAYYTPGSINTPMGISRIIREKLPPGVSYFIVEMGAYGPGSIARLCALTPPKLGIITALGEAHYERFKSLDAVARTKFELAEAVINNSSDGKAIVHESVLEQPFAREFVNKHKQRFSVCGAGEGCDFRIVSSGLTDKGVALILRWEGRDYEMFAPLFGAHNIGNLAVTFAAAVHCGVAPEVAIAAMRKTPQVAHRLEVRRPSGERIIIDDAYNANAKGFEAALELLSFLANGESRRVLVTPGMVELGAQHDKLHRDLGASAAKHADTAIVVQPERIRTFVEAFKDTAPEKQLVEVATFNEAQAWVDANVKEPAVILLENDLPDLYERRMNT